MIVLTMNESPRRKLGRQKVRACFMAGGRIFRFLRVALTLALPVCFPWAALFGIAPVWAAKQKPATTYSIPLPPAPDFSSLDWIIGNWSGKISDRETPGDVRFSAAYDLDKRVMIFREVVSTPSTNANSAGSETWMGILSGAGLVPGFIFRVFSSTGFITRYRVRAEGGEIHFNPEGGEQPPPEWLFRRVIARTGADELTETVSAAPPQKAFFTYYTAKLTRAKPAAPKAE